MICVKRVEARAIWVSINSRRWPERRRWWKPWRWRWRWRNRIHRIRTTNENLKYANFSVCTNKRKKKGENTSGTKYYGNYGIPICDCKKGFKILKYCTIWLVFGVAHEGDDGLQPHRDVVGGGPSGVSGGAKPGLPPNENKNKKFPLPLCKKNG